MMSKKKAIQIATIGESSVYSSVFDISQLIQMHAELGMFEMEVFITKDCAKKCVKALDKKRFYSKITNFKALEHECRLYVSWISTL